MSQEDEEDIPLGLSKEEWATMLAEMERRDAISRKPGENALLDELDALEASGQSLTAPPQESSGVLATAGKVAKDIGGGIMELPGQVNRGVASAINETSGAMYGLVTQPAVKWVHENLFDMSGIAPGIVAGTANPLAIPLDTAATPKAETVTGSLVKEVTQFATAYYAGGRLLKAAGMVAPTTAGAAVAQGAGRGALVDMLSFDPYEERLSNLIETHTSLRDPVTQFLAARPDDSQAAGRLKNAVEGLGIGMAAEGLIHVLKGVKAMRAGNREEALKAFDELEASDDEVAFAEGRVFYAKHRTRDLRLRRRLLDRTSDQALACEVCAFQPPAALERELRESFLRLTMSYHWRRLRDYARR